MRRYFLLAILGLCFLPQACKRVQIRVDGDDPVRVTVPLFLVFEALRFTDEDVLEIDDLAGIDEEIPLYALAKAIRDGNDQIKVQYRQGDTRISGEKRGRVFHVEMDNPEEEERLLLNLPVALMDALLESQEGEINPKKVKRALKRFSGTLLEVQSEDERLRIVIR